MQQQMQMAPQQRQLNTQQGQRQEQPQEPPYLFYSTNCAHSHKIIEMIKQIPPLVQGLKPVPIENVNPASLPSNLERVPSILIKGQLLSGNDAFGWVQLEGQRFQNFQQQQQQQPSLQNGGVPGEGVMPGSGGMRQSPEQLMHDQGQIGGGLEAFDNGEGSAGFATLGTETNNGFMEGSGSSGNFSILGAPSTSGIDPRLTVDDRRGTQDQMKNAAEQFQQSRAQETNQLKNFQMQQQGIQGGPGIARIS